MGRGDQLPKAWSRGRSEISLSHQILDGKIERLSGGGGAWRITSRSSLLKRKWFISGGHQAVSGKGRSLTNSIHRASRRSGGDRGNLFIEWVSLSLVSWAICTIAIRSSRNDLMVVIGQNEWVYNIIQMKCGLSNQWEDRRKGTWRYGVTSRNVQRDAYGWKVRFWGPFAH